MSEGQQAPTQKAPDRLSWGHLLTVLIATAPGLAYFLAFLYEGGYCSAFRIPLFLVQPDLSSVLRILALFMGGVVSCLFLLHIWFSHLARLFSANRRLFAFIVVNAGALLTLWAVWYSLNRSLWDLAKIVVWYAMLTFVLPPLILRLLDRSSKPKGKKDLLEHVSTVLASQENPWLITKQGLFAFTSIFLSIVGCITSACLGVGNARREEVFLVLRGDPGFALVRVYSERGVLVEYDPSTRKILSGVRVVPLGDPSMVFETRHIGELDFSAVGK